MCATTRRTEDLRLCLDLLLGRRVALMAYSSTHDSPCHIILSVRLRHPENATKKEEQLDRARSERAMSAAGSQPDFEEELQLVNEIRKKLTRDRTVRALGQEGIARAQAWVDKIASTNVETDKQQKTIIKYYCKQLFQQVEQGRLTTPFNRPPPKVPHWPC